MMTRFMNRVFGKKYGMTLDQVLVLEAIYRA